MVISNLLSNFAHTMRQFYFFIYFLFTCLSISAQFSNNIGGGFSANVPKYEVRGVWLTTIGGLDWPSSYAQSSTGIEKQKKQLCDILDQLDRAGVNTVFLQTRVRATTIYPSKYEPWDGCMSGIPGKSPGYDPLAFAIEECHKRGMQLHAWVVTIPVGKWNKLGCTSLRKKYPKLIRKIGEDGYMNPEMPQTGDIIADICDEIVENYDVDGIHLDYIRYPETWKITVSNDKGRGYITSIVEKIYKVVKNRKPWVMISCSPIGKRDDLPRQSSRGWNARTRVLQDAGQWLRTGLMDALFPMMYFKDNNFYPFAIDWKEQSCGKIVAPGLGIYFMHPKEKNWSLETITSEMQMLRQWGMGHCYFRSKFFTDNTKGLYDFAQKEFDNYPALVPPMTWKTTEKPQFFSEITTDSTTQTLSWQKAKDTTDSPYLLYNIYSSRTWPVDVSDAHNLVKRGCRDTSIRVPLDGRYYAVTAMNRYGNESEAKQNASFGLRKTSDSRYKVKDADYLLPCDGRILKVPVSSVNRTDLLCIVTMQGKTIKTVMQKQEIDVRKVPEGMYELRSLGKKNVSHRLGFFQIKRK